MLFYTVGYRIVFSYLEKQATTQLDVAIDEGKYNEQNLIEIKIPLNLPYFSDKEYEVAYGETEIEGTHYQYVKRKVSNNILYLICLPNNVKNTLVAAKNKLEKNNSQAGDNKSDQKNPSLSISKSVQQEFLQASNEYRLANNILGIQNLPKISNSKAGDLFTPLTPTQPPEFCI